MKKTALLLAFALIFCLGACKGKDTALTVNGTAVDEAEYAFYLNYNRYDVQGTDENDLEKVRQAAVEQIVSNEIVRAKCAELGLKPSSEQKENLKKEKAEFIESIGGKANYLTYLNESRLTDRTYDKLAENEIYFDLLYDYVCAESDRSFSDNELRRFFAENYIGVKYIFFSVTNEGGEPMNDEETAQVKALAESVLQEAQENDADFDELISKHSDDPFLAGDSEGMIVSRLEAQEQSYLDGAFTLENNRVGGVFSDAAGFYIVKRLPVDASFYEENQADIHDTALNMRFSETLREWCENAEVSVKKSAEKIDFDNIEDYIR